MENDDLGWASPYTLTPSAINSWIGDELRTIGSEGNVRWKTDLGTVSLLGAVLCCNDEAGILMADRGWTMDDRPTGLFERVAPSHRHPGAVPRPALCPHRPVRRAGWPTGLVWRRFLAGGGRGQDFRHPL